MTRSTSSVGQLALLTAAWAVMLFLPACGSDDAPTLDEIASMSVDEIAKRAKKMKDLSGLKACELLTAAEIEAATGIRPGEPEDISQVQGQLPMCNWPSADGRGRVVASILVTRAAYGGYDDFVEKTRSQMREMAMEFNEEDWQHVPDVGDFGIWLGEDYAGGMLQVYDGGLMVQVDAETAEGKNELAASKELAEKALARIS